MMMFNSDRETMSSSNSTCLYRLTELLEGSCVRTCMIYHGKN